MFSNTLKRPFVTAALVGGLLIAAAPAGANAASPGAGADGARQAISDGTSNTVSLAEAGHGDRGRSPDGFSWSETQAI